MSEGSKANPLFPTTDPTMFVVAPNGPSIRGVEGLRPLAVVFPRISINFSDDGAYQPVAGLAAYQAIASAGSGDSGVIINDGFDRASFWILDLLWDEPGPRSTLPRNFEFHIRTSIAGTAATTMAIFDTSFSGWDDAGFLIQVSGILCSQWELWARIKDDEGSPGQRQKVRFGGIVDRFAGGVTNIQYGTLVNNHVPF